MYSKSHVRGNNIHAREFTWCKIQKSLKIYSNKVWKSGDFGLCMPDGEFSTNQKSFSLKSSSYFKNV
jgi:hypothetical protein